MYWFSRAWLTSRPWAGHGVVLRIIDFELFTFVFLTAAESLAPTRSICDNCFSVVFVAPTTSWSSFSKIRYSLSAVALTVVRGQRWLDQHIFVLESSTRATSTDNASLSQGNGLNRNASAPASLNCCSISFALKPHMTHCSPRERRARTVSVPNICFSTDAIFRSVA